MIVQFIQNLFPLKAKTLNQFIKFVRDGEGNIVRIEPGILRDNDIAIPNACLTDWHYLIDFESKTLRGRRIIYQEECFYTMRSARTQIFEAKERNRMSVQMFLTGEKRMKYIKNELPSIRVDLIAPSRKPMGNVLFKQLHHDAKKVGLSLS